MNAPPVNVAITNPSSLHPGVCYYSVMVDNILTQIYQKNAYNEMKGSLSEWLDFSPQAPTTQTAPSSALG
jgi:hypothetical protein